jgi:hypothetical protein
VSSVAEAGTVEEFGFCAVCARMPLVGEGITVYRAKGGTDIGVCDLCLEKPRTRTLGEPVRRDRVRSAAGAANVQRIFPRPVGPRPGGAPATPPASVG